MRKCVDVDQTLVNTRKGKERYTCTMYIYIYIYISDAHGSILRPYMSMCLSFLAFDLCVLFLVSMFLSFIPLGIYYFITL